MNHYSNHRRGPSSPWRVRSKKNAATPYDGGVSRTNGNNRFTDIQRISILCETFGGVAGALGDAVFVTDENGAIVFVNRAAEVMTGTDLVAAQMLHIGDLLFMPLDSELRHYNDLLRCGLDDGLLISRSGLPITTRRGDIKYFDFRVCPLIDDDSSLYGSVLIASDFYDIADAVTVRE